MTDPRAKETTKDLRDARLAQALRHAPDAQALPSPALRDTIQTIAASAVATKTTDSLHVKTTWWHTLWASMGSARGPWGGALATVLLGCIVTAMWYGQDVPDEQVRYSGAAPEAASADVAAPASAPSAPTTVASTPPAATIAAAPVQAPDPAPATAPAPTATPNRAQSGEVAAPQVEQRAAPAAREALADKAKEQATAEAALARREADASNPVVARPASGAAPVAPAPAANLAAAPSAPATTGALLAPSSAAAKASSALRHQSKPTIATAATNWHSASVQYQGRSTQLAAADAQRLQGYVMAVVSSATPQALPGALPTTAPMLRIVFTEAAANANPNGAQAVFTVWTGAMQWQRTEQPDVVGVPQADALAQLLAQASSLQK